MNRKTGIKSLYVHIPFCAQKCNYCDFVSYPLKDSGKLCTDYAPMLVKELVIHDKEIDFSQLETVYIGGGTPTIFPDLVALLNYLPRPAYEFTVEANPATVNYDLLCDLRRGGVNRLSFGVQSFDDANLARMGRLHNAKDALDAIYLAREAGFDNISIDLMFGLPEQSLDAWERDLDKAISLHLPHISTYALTLAEGTPWAIAAKNGELETDDDLAADMLLLARQKLRQAGYIQYEISNFTIEGYECRHNYNYWRRVNYLGIGINASSCINDIRTTNMLGELYAEALKAGRKPIGFSEQLSEREIISETVFLILRTAKGLDMQAFYEHFGIDINKMFKKEIVKLKALGLLHEEGGCLMLTDKALPVANQVFCRFV